MDFVILAYAAVWLGVMFYVARLGAQQRRLTGALDALENRLAETSAPQGRAMTAQDEVLGQWTRKTCSPERAR